VDKIVENSSTKQEKSQKFLSKNTYSAFRYRTKLGIMNLWELFPLPESIEIILNEKRRTYKDVRRYRESKNLI